MEAAREEWDEYRVQRVQDEEDLFVESEGEFMYSRAVWEDHFRSGIDKLHDHFMRVIQEHLGM